jgi:hypothetical protein
VAAKAEGVADGDTNFSLLRLPGNIVYIYITGRVDIVEVDSRGDKRFFDSLAADNQLDCTGRTERVSEGAFSGADGEFIGVPAKNGADSDTFGDIVKLGAGSVGVDVIDLFNSDLAVGEGKFHSLCGACAV